MTTRHLRHALATAAVIAALAATGCGSQSLSEDLGSDVDLLSSTNNSAPVEEAGLRDLLDVKFDGPVHNMIPLDKGNVVVDHDSYSDSLNADEYDAVVGTGFDGEKFVQIEEELLGLHSAPGQMAFARWDFSNLHAGLKVIKYIRVQGSASFEEDSGYYIAVSNYEDDDWEILGPYFEFNEFISTRHLPSVSEAGVSRIAVIAYGGTSVELRGMNLSVGHPHADAASD